jgi:hypothetical protein
MLVLPRRRPPANGAPKTYKLANSGGAAIQIDTLLTHSSTAGKPLLSGGPVAQRERYQALDVLCIAHTRKATYRDA